MRKIFFAVCACFMLTIMVQAGGYRVALQGVRNAAMAHTSAHTHDASVMFFNPAALGFVENKLSVAIGAFGIMSESEYQNSNTNYAATTDNDLSTPAYLAASYRAFEDVTFGLSVTTPFGSSLNWGDDWAGAPIVQNIDLTAIFIQPTVAVKFNDWFAAGLGIIYAHGQLELNKSIPNVNGKLTLMDDDASGLGFNVGAFFKPNDKMNVSLAYRSNINMEANAGDAEFDVSSALISPTSPFKTANDKFNATLPLVSEFTVGLSYKVTPKLLLAADVNFAGWDTYRSLTFDFEQNTVGNDPNDATRSITPKNFRQSNVYRIGGEYSVNSNLALRLGYYYDHSPVRDNYWSPETPSTNNHAFTGGLGYKWNKFTFDLFAAMAKGEVRDINNANAGFYGETRSNAVYFGLGLSYNAF